MEEERQRNFDVGQRIKVKEQGDYAPGPPIEVRGKDGTVEGMAGMVARGQEIPQQWINKYVVAIDDGDDPTVVITGDWLELLVE